MATFYSNISSYYQLRLDISQASQDITNNTSSVYYKLTLTSGYSSFAKWGHIRWLIINGATVYSDTSQIAIGAQSSLVLAEGYTTVPHNNDGTKTVSFSASFDSGGSRPDYIVQTALVLSGSLALTTIPRASMISRTYASRELGETQTFSINRASTSFTHLLRYRIGLGSWVNLVSDVATSHNWTLPVGLAYSVTNSTSATITVECFTYSGGTHIGTSSTTFTMTIPNNDTFKPSAVITWVTPVNALGGEPVQGKSSVRVTSSRSAQYGASITETRVTIDGSNYYGTDVTSGVINKSGSISISLVVTDSRGFSRTVSSGINFQPYSSPVISSFSASRSPTDQSTNLSVGINFSISPVANQNTRYYRVRYRPTGGSWVNLVTSDAYYSRNTTHSANGVLDTEIPYEVELYVADYYTSVTRTLNIGTAFVLMDYNESGRGLAIGKVSESDIFEVGMHTKFTYTPRVGNTTITRHYQGTNHAGVLANASHGIFGAITGQHYFLVTITNSDNSGYWFGFWRFNYNVHSIPIKIAGTFDVNTNTHGTIAPTDNKYPYLFSIYALE